jgi:hypothetical protein
MPERRPFLAPLRRFADSVTRWRRARDQPIHKRVLARSKRLHQEESRAPMTPLTIIDSPFATLWYHPGPGIVHHRIHKFIHGQAFRDLLLAGLDTLQKNRAQKWLSDDRANAVLWPEDVDWSHTFWFPQTVQAGWKYWAIVQPEKTVGQVTMKGLANDYARQGVTSRTFLEPEAALAWLDPL